MDPYITAMITAAADSIQSDRDNSRYREDPAAWAHDRLDAHMWTKQLDIAQSVADNRRTAVKSCHGVGKSWTAGMLACWWIDTHPPGEAFVVSTAPTAKQVSAVLWEEIRKQHGRGGLPGEVLLTDEWKIDRTLVGMGRKPADHDVHGFQGIHRRYVLAILDEACGIPKSLWTGVEAITTNADCRILAIGNPDDPNTEFGRNCGPGSGWTVQQISAFDSPNFTGEDVPDELRYLLPSVEWVEDARKRWGEDSPLYQSKVLGEFPDVGDDTLIPPGWIQAAMDRDLPATDDQRLAVDVARFGSDRTVLLHTAGPVARIVGSYAKQATTQTAGRVTAAAADLVGDIEVRVDGVGVGGGVVDMLAENGVPVIDMQAGAAPVDSEHFVNARAEWYWALRLRFESGDIDLPAGSDQLAAQLGALRFAYDSRGRIKIESKDDMRRRGLPSPDEADALMLAYAPVVPPATITGDDLDDDLADFADYMPA